MAIFLLFKKSYTKFTNYKIADVVLVIDNKSLTKKFKFNLCKKSIFSTAAERHMKSMIPGILKSQEIKNDINLKMRNLILVFNC